MEERKTTKPETVHDPANKDRDHETILLVDDEDIILSSLKRVLQRSGFDVVAVNDGLEALNLFCRKPEDFDLVITDQSMPQITGVALGKKLMEIRSDIPVILCTGYSDTIGDNEARALGFRELIIKPAGMHELKSAVSRALEA